MIGVQIRKATDKEAELISSGIFYFEADELVLAHREFEKAAQLMGDGIAHSWIVNDLLMRGIYGFAFEYATKQIVLGNTHCLSLLGHCYLEGKGCRKNIVYGTTLMLQSKRINSLASRLYQNKEKTNVECFMYGRHYNEIMQWQKWDMHNQVRLERCRFIFAQSCIQAHRSVLCFIWCFKQLKLCSHDVRKHIAKMLWETRVEADKWFFLI